MEFSHSVRCGNRACRALLFKTASNAMKQRIEIKCRRCGTMNLIGPERQEPKPKAGSVLKQ